MIPHHPMAVHHWQARLYCRLSVKPRTKKHHNQNGGFSPNRMFQQAGHKKTGDWAAHMWSQKATNMSRLISNILWPGVKLGYIIKIKIKQKSQKMRPINQPQNIWPVEMGRQINPTDCGVLAQFSAKQRCDRFWHLDDGWIRLNHLNKVVGGIVNMCEA